MFTFTLRSVFQMIIGSIAQKRPGAALNASFRLLPFDMDIYGNGKGIRQILILIPQVCAIGDFHTWMSGVESFSTYLHPTLILVVGHCNNACYFRLAELARWRQIAQSGLLFPSIKNKWMFLIAEQTIAYKKPILPFRKFVVRSEIKMDGKWIYYDHYFQSSPDTSTAIQYAHIQMKSVIKKPNGKTVMPDEVLSAVPALRAWVDE